MSDSVKGKVIQCFSCGNSTFMEEVARYENVQTYEDDGFPECLYIRKWLMYFCPVCNNVTLELVAIDDPGCIVLNTTDIQETIIYPQIQSDKRTIPNSVKKAFEAALKVRLIDGAICALSLRRTLEMLCKDKGEVQGSLFEKLKNLSTNGILPPILDDMADILRKVGNDAAHAEDKDFPPYLVKSMIEFTEVIIDYVYVLPHKLDSIQANLNQQ